MTYNFCYRIYKNLVWRYLWLHSSETDLPISMKFVFPPTSVTNVYKQFNYILSLIVVILSIFLNLGLKIDGFDELDDVRYRLKMNEISWLGIKWLNLMIIMSMFFDFLSMVMIDVIIVDKELRGSIFTECKSGYIHVWIYRY